MAKGNTAFYIARRYLIAKKGSQAVSFITGLAAFAMMVAVAAMFIIISVFSGLEDLNKDFISNLHADLTLKSTQGKVIPNIQKVTSTLKSENEISHFSKMIEEKVYIDYKNTGEIAYIRGVDSAYVKVTGKTKEQFDEHQRLRREKYEEEKRKHEESIPELTKEWINKGNKILDKEYHELWTSCVPIRLSDLYRGMELGASLEIIDKLNKNCSLDEAKDIIDNQGHSGMSYSLVRSMVKSFCKRGNEFANYTK